MKNVVLKLALIVSVPLVAYFIAHDPLVRALGTAIVFWPAAIVAILVIKEAYDKSRSKVSKETLSLKAIAACSAACWAILAFANLYYFG